MSRKIRIAVIREKITKVTRILSGRGIRVTQSGMSAFVQYDEHTLEPKRVNIPYLPDDASEDLIAAIEGFVDHEVAHLLFSDAKAIVESQKYKVQSLHNIIEDVFIERKMCKEFSGTEYNLNKMYLIFTDKFIEPKYQTTLKHSGTKEIDWWHLLCACACRALGGQEHFKEYMADKWKHLPKIQAALLPFEERILNSKDSWENLEIAIDLRDAIYGKREEPEEEKPEEEPDFDDEEAEESEEEGIEDDDIEEDDEEIDDEDLSDEEPDDEEDEELEDEDPESDDEIEDEDLTDEEEMPKEPTRSEDSEEEEGGAHHDMGEPDEDSEGKEAAPLEGEDSEESMEHIEDFDDGMSELINTMAGDSLGESTYMPFTKDWDLIERFPVPSSFSEHWIESIENEVQGMTGTLQKGLERAFRAANKSRWEAGKKTGRVNSAALSRLLTNDARVFRTREEIKTKEVAVSLLIDCSGSMSGSRIQIATETAWALSEVLSKLGINFEVLGFTTTDKRWYEDDFSSMSSEMTSSDHTWSRTEPVYIPIFKAFEERWGVEQKRRTASIPRALPLANNVDGESLEYAANRLLRQKEPGKTLIVLSDGAPCALGSTYDYMTHLNEVIKDIEKKQVNVVGIGIQTSAVREFYRKNVVIHKLEELPLTVMNKLRDAILQK